jgi:hypothetical protein|tara:strand:+ start:274 stop:837 length:564 start_codon:yes stop_codon:yes gene_type:complete
MSLITYIDYLQKKNADDLAFYPIAALEKALDMDRVITCQDNEEPAGYIWHGPIRPGFDAVIYQACVDYQSRRRHLGWDMVRKLINICKVGSGTGVRLRAASSSDSNDFWRQIGFYCTKVTQGGVRRSREINHWRTDVQRPLFTIDPVSPSKKIMNPKSYFDKRKRGDKMPGVWARRYPTMQREDTNE